MFSPQPAGLDVAHVFPSLKNGELIYGCKDARGPMADWSELAHHLKPFFFPSNGLAGGPHCTRAVIRELVRVITRVLLSGSDKGRAGALRSGPGLRGPAVCEASPFSRSPHCQGGPGGWAGLGAAERVAQPARGPPGLTELLQEEPGSCQAPQGRASLSLSPGWGALLFHLLSGFVNRSAQWGCRLFPRTSHHVSAPLWFAACHCNPWDRFSFSFLSWGELRLEMSGSYSSKPFRRVGGSL